MSLSSGNNSTLKGLLIQENCVFYARICGRVS